MSIRARRRSVNAAGYVPRVGPPDIPQATATWWAGDMALADGATISTWTDRVSAIDLTPGFNTNSNPFATYKASAIGGNPAASFTSYDHGLVANGLTFSTNTGSIVIVCNYPTTGKIFQLMSSTLSETGFGYAFDSGFGLAYNKTSNYIAAPTAEQAAYQSGPCIIEISSPLGTIDPTVSLVVRINNEIVHTYYQSAPVASATWNTLSQLVLSADRFGSSPTFEYAASSTSAVTDLDIAFVGVYSGPLTEANRSIIYNWLEAHYEIPCGTYVADTTYFPPPVTNILGNWWANDLLLSTENSTVSWNNRQRSKNMGSGGSPTFRQKGFYGKPGVYFPGSSRMTNSTPYTNSAGSVIMIVEFDSINGATLWSETRSSSDNYYVQGVVSTAGQIEIHERNNNTVDRIRGGTAITAGSRYMLEWTSSGSLYSMRINDVAETLTSVTGSNAGHWMSIPPSLNRINFGVRYASTTGTYLQGRIAYIGITSAAISSTDRAAVLTWANGYYGSGNAAPVGVINVGNTSVEKDLPIVFTSVGSYDPDGSIASYAWDFGNGVTSTSANPTAVTYTSYGTYNVTLTLTDNKGLSSVTTKVMTVTPNVPPVAAFTYGGAATAPALIGFDASTSSDATGPGANTIVSYAWDFDNSNTGTGMTTSETFSEGTYDVTLTVTDDLGATDTETHTIVIGPDPGPPPSPANTEAKWWARDVSTDSGNSYGLVTPPSGYSNRWIDSVNSLTFSENPDPFLWASSALNGRDTMTGYVNSSAGSLASYSNTGSVFVFFKDVGGGGGSSVALTFGSGATSLMLIAYPNGGTISGDFGSGMKAALFTGASPSAEYFLMEVGSTGSSNYARVNNVAASLSNPYFPTYGNLAGEWTNDLTSSTGSMSLSWSEHYVGFILVTSSVPTSTERTDIVNWINSYYGITLGTS